LRGKAPFPLKEEQIRQYMLKQKLKTPGYNLTRAIDMLKREGKVIELDFHGEEYLFLQSLLKDLAFLKDDKLKYKIQKYLNTYPEKVIKTHFGTLEECISDFLRTPNDYRSRVDSNSIYHLLSDIENYLGVSLSVLNKVRDNFKDLLINAIKEEYYECLNKDNVNVLVSKEIIRTQIDNLIKRDYVDENFYICKKEIKNIKSWLKQKLQIYVVEKENICEKEIYEVLQKYNMTREIFNVLLKQEIIGEILEELNFTNKIFISKDELNQLGCRYDKIIMRDKEEIKKLEIKLKNILKLEDISIQKITELYFSDSIIILYMAKYYRKDNLKTLIPFR